MSLAIPLLMKVPQLFALDAFKRAGCGLLFGQTVFSDMDRELAPTAYKHRDTLDCSASGQLTELPQAISLQISYEL
jgi:hypothetical protein